MADEALHRRIVGVAAAYPGEELRVVCDNYATCKHADVRAWLPRPENQRITLQFVPTSCSWLNLVECFSVITRQAIRRGSFASVSELISAIGAFTGHWNEHPRPFIWTKNADEILASIQRAKTETNSFTPLAPHRAVWRARVALAAWPRRRGWMRPHKLILSGAVR
jgi:hypothetical protein